MPPLGLQVRELLDEAAEIDQIIAKQNKRDQAIWSFKQFFSVASTTVSGARFVLKPVAVERHKRCFGSREKC